MAEAPRNEASRQDARATRRWRFGNVVLDGRSQTLLVDGAPIELDPKPLEVLFHLLHHAGEVVTKDELLAAVWPGRVISDSALTSCVARLREALHDEQQALIKTVHRYGYRLVAEVSTENVQGPAPAHFDFKPGEPAPMRPQWLLVERLGAGGHGEAWLVQHDKTRERRVFKFALDDSCIPSLKREVTVSRLLQDGLGERGAAYARVLEWNFEQQPYFIECEHAVGGSLVAWAAAQGGLDKVPMATRLDLAIQIAEALASAHAMDVLHKDLKPSNVLIEPRAEGSPRVKLCDFGSGGVLDLKRLEALGITKMGFTQTLQDGMTSGTPVYFSPEVLSGQPATRQSDIYALGVILYQLVVGDLKRPLALGWEHDVDDELLREDISATAAGKPQRRLTDASQLLERLRTLPQRRAERQARAVQSAPLSARPAQKPTGVVATVVASIAAVAAVLLWRGVPVAPSSAPRVVMVKPFIGANADGVDYFAAAATEEFVAAIGKVKGLRAVRAPKDSAQPGEPGPAPIAVLSGELKRDGGGFEGRWQLASGEGGSVLWAQAYRRPLADLQSAENDVMDAVVAALDIALHEDLKGQLVDWGTTNLAAYEAFIGVDHNPYYSSIPDEERNTESIAGLERAVALDPGFARAYAALAGAYQARVYWISPDDTLSLKKGFAAAERSLTLNPRMVDAHLAKASLAVVPANGFDYGLAIKETKLALALDDQRDNSWATLASVYGHVGLFDEALTATDKAFALNPSPAYKMFPCSWLTWGGRSEDALNACESNSPTGPFARFWFWNGAWALMDLGRYGQAEARLEEFFKTNKDVGGLVTGRRAVLYAARGENEAALADIKVAAANDPRFGHFHHTAYDLGCAYALMNRREEAMRWLSQAAHAGFPNYVTFQRDANLKSLRDDPEFQKLMAWLRQQLEHYRSLAQ